MNGDTSTEASHDLDEELAAFLATLNEEELAAFIDTAVGADTAAGAPALAVTAATRFDKLKEKLSRKGVRDPAALAAEIGRKKYGRKKFQEMAEHGRARAASAVPGRGARVTAQLPVSGMVASVDHDNGNAVLDLEDGTQVTVPLHTVAPEAPAEPDLSGLTASALTAAISQGVTEGVLDAIRFARELDELDQRMKATS